MKTEYQIVIIGGGPAGLAAAVAAYDGGVRDLAVFERESRTGGILNQCIHNGFGLTRFKESMTGPEYAARFEREAERRGIEIYTDTTVLSLGADKTVTAMSPREGVFTVRAKAMILAMGCRERSRGALNIAGSRPAGIYSAGTAQKYVNVKGYLPGKDVVILGSGDIGLIMARRMTLEGARVHAVCEIMPYSSGLRRNIAQCLDDFGIPLYLNHTITKIEGAERVTGVVVSRVDENRHPVPGSEIHFACDTVLFSVGLIPENELTRGAGIAMSPRTKGAIVDQNRETQTEGIFACGNVLQVHDLVDFVSEEAETAGAAAARYVLGGRRERNDISVSNGRNVSYVLPQKIDKNTEGDVKLYFRVSNTLRDCTVKVESGGAVVAARKRRIATPGEMETFVVKREVIADAEGELRVYVEEKEDD